MTEMTPKQVEETLVRFGERPEAAKLVREAFEQPTEERLLMAMRAVFGAPGKS